MSECKVYLGNLSYDTGERWDSNFHKPISSRQQTSCYSLVIVLSPVIGFICCLRPSSDCQIQLSIVHIYTKNWSSENLSQFVGVFFSSFWNAQIQDGLCQTTSLLKFWIFSEYSILSFVNLQTKVKKSARKLLPFAVVGPTVIQVTWSLGSLLGPPQLVGVLTSGAFSLGMCWASLDSISRTLPGHPPNSWAKGQNLGHTGHHPSWASDHGHWASPWVWSRFKMGRALFLGRSLWLMPVSALS